MRKFGDRTGVIRGQTGEFPILNSKYGIHPSVPELPELIDIVNCLLPLVLSGSGPPVVG